MLFTHLLGQLWKRFRGEDKPPAHLGASRDYNVDMVPKVQQSYPMQIFLSSPLLAQLMYAEMHLGLHKYNTNDQPHDRVLVLSWRERFVLFVCDLCEIFADLGIQRTENPLPNCLKKKKSAKHSC